MVKEWIDPDFTQTLFPIIEERLGRKLSVEENKRFAYTSGMRKEWFFDCLEKCETVDQAEQLFATCHLSAVGRPEYPWFIRLLRKLKL